MAYKRELLVRVAKLYYEENKTQNEIADIIDVTRQTVARMLEAAKESGIIKINVLDESEQYFNQIAGQLKDIFGLDDVIIEMVYDNSPEAIRYSLGLGASKYLEGKLVEGQTLGCSWGRTLLEVVKGLKRSNKRVNVVQLNGFIGQVYNEFNSNELARILSSKFNGNFYFLPAPGIVESKKMRNLLLNEKSIKLPIQMAYNGDVAAIGIGSLENSLLYQFGFFSKEDINRMAEENVVGDLCLRLINEQGEEVKTNWNERIIGIELEALKKIDTVIGIAGGKSKVNAILGALRGNYLDVLVTDSYTAEQLINKVKK